MLTGLVGVAACSRVPSNGAIELAVPGRANAQVTLASDGPRVAAAWAATGATGTDIFLALSDDGGRTFGAPLRVNDVGGDASANGEQPPRVVVKGNALSVIWVSKRGGATGIRTAASDDAGATFGATRTISPPGATGARGWESAAFSDDGALHAAWLDGRNASASARAAADTSASSVQATAGKSAPAGGQSGAPAAHVHHDGPMRQDIYHAMWTGSEAPIETPVATNVCFCCKTAIVTRGTDVYIAWRHLFPGGVRDIAVARSSDGGRTFSEPVRVSADNWKIDACPDDGPAMSIGADGALSVVWPTLVQTGRTPRMGIFEAISRDGGATFSPRTQVDGGTAAPAHPRLVVDGRRSAVVWDELAEGSRRVMLRIGDAAPVALSQGRAASYPAVVASGNAFVVAYTDQLEDRSVVRVLRVP
jgi:hypothetical protein